jgi:hypothetical protein
VEKESEVARVSWYARDGGGGVERRQTDGLSHLFQALEAFDRSIRARRQPQSRLVLGWSSPIAHGRFSGRYGASNFA